MEKENSIEIAVSLLMIILARLQLTVEGVNLMALDVKTKHALIVWYMKMQLEV